MRRDINRSFAASIAVKRRFLRENLDGLVHAVGAIAEAFRAGNKLLLFGNGGSAADAQHIAAEFVNRFKMERPPLPAIALTTDSSALTSIGNDYGYAEVFAKQVRALGRRGDVAIAISTSGNAVNVLRAVAACRRIGVRTIALTGGTGGKLAGAADLVLRVAGTTETARIQETHILVGHVICEQVDALLFGGQALSEPSPRPTPGGSVDKRDPHPSRRSLEKGPPQGERKFSFENKSETARPEEPPSSGGVSKGARWRKSTVPGGRGRPPER